MPPLIDISIENLNKEPKVLRYELVDNPIASQWYQKIRHLHRVPLDRYYTFRVLRDPPDNLQKLIAQDLEILRSQIGLNYPTKDKFNQEDCNELHSLTVATQYNYDRDIREIFHRLHRNLHSLEQQTLNIDPYQIYAGWGENEGLITGKFNVNPYDYYESCNPGDIYLVWSEFGKSPYDYWRDRDLDDPEHFFENCKAQSTFRAQFSLIRFDPPNKFPKEFENWFDRYKSKWQEKWGIGWEPIHQWGGIPLCRTKDKFDPANTNTIIGIKII